MTRVSNTPSTRPEVIQSLIDGVDRHKPDNVSILEEYFATQRSNREVEVDAISNLVVLKLRSLCQFNPYLVNDQVVNNIPHPGQGTAG
ncbi:hypothetical protein BGX23_000383 [Mortierella sp. AD031]|nr:hypothetical protein BGX23_000383 [Mortierella sp. AD031]KAG0209775.1 hypothetical protein BGX33_005355 [Mortierella sp. NVP41]